MPSKTFRGHEISNLPLMETRREFGMIRADLLNPETRRAFAVPLPERSQLIRVGTAYFGLFLEQAITYAYQRSFLCLEGHVSGAVYLTGIFGAGKNASMIAAATRNPFGETGRYTRRKLTPDEQKRPTVPVVFYNVLPSLVDKDLALSKMRPDLVPQIDDLYQNLRNPLFHGHCVSRCKWPEVEPVLEVFSEMFDWIDDWAVGLNDVMQGAFRASE